MLHELVVALRGHPGHVFQEREGKFLVNPALSLFHPCEVALLNQVLELAADYRTVASFISRHGSGGEEGMYLEAVCHGIDEVIQPYLTSLARLEERVVSEGEVPPLSLLHHSLLPHRPLLRRLVHLIADIQAEDAPKGCMLLDLVYRAASTGVQGAGEALEEVLAVGHQVLYRQLLAWLLQGHLYDPHSEFFIVPEEEGEGEESILVGEQEGELSRSKSKRYRLEPRQVPGHISHALAEKIFFIGESIQLFESDRRVEVQGDVLRSREMEFYKELAKLRDSKVFSVTEFGGLVERVRESVSGHLHSLVVRDSGLGEELRTVWDVFLLGRGELALAFITAADSVLRSPPGAATQHDTLQAWQSALAQHEGEERITSRVTPRVGRDSSGTGWQQLKMQYAVPWPLHLVVTAQALEKYNRIHSFLLLVRRTQRDLHQLWSEAMLRSRASHQAGSIQAEDQTRTHMAFLIDSLQYYLMADVLETKMTAFTAKLEKSTSFEEVKLCHDLFLTEVQASIFLHNPQVQKCLTDLMDNCQQFCKARSNQVDASAQTLAFSRQSALLLQLLASLRSHLAPPGLAQLLTRIDYNRFFSKHNRTSQ